MERTCLTLFTSLTLGAGLDAQVLFEVPPARTPPFGTHVEAHGAAVADFDGDGALDVFLPGGLTSSCYLRKNRGYVPHPLGTTVRALHALAADVDADGDVDVLAGGSWPALLLVNQGGTLTAAPQRLPHDLSYTSAILVRLGASPRPELVVTTARGVRLLQQDAAGIYQDVTPPDFPTTVHAHVVSADFDGDGDQDLAFGGAFGVGFLLQDSAGWTFAPFRPEPCHGLHACDLDRNGTTDLVQVSTDQTIVADQRSGRTWTRRALVPGNPRYQNLLAVADLDRDLDIDLVVVSHAAPGLTQVLLNDGSGVFAGTPADTLRVRAGPGATYASVTVADFDGDGNVDLLHTVDATSGHRDVVPRLHLREGQRWIESTGDRAFRILERSVGDAVSSMQPLSVADFDRDGDLDVVEHGGTLLLQEPDGVPTRVVAVPAPRNSGSTLVALDLDRDGVTDLVRFEPDPSGPTLATWRNDGTARFTPSGSSILGTTSEVAVARAVGDLDGDGDDDLYLALASGKHQVLLSDGRGGLVAAAGAVPFLAENTKGVALADLDGDGDLDLVLANFESTSGSRSRLLRNRGGVFTDITASALPPLASVETSGAVCAADLDHDGDLDLAFFGTSAGSASSRWMRNLGNGTFAVAGSLPAALRGEGRALAADVDEDGDLDIVVGPAIGKPIHLCENRGGNFVDASSRIGFPSSVTTAIPQALRDLDEDGDLDLLALVAPAARRGRARCCSRGTSVGSPRPRRREPAHAGSSSSRRNRSAPRGPGSCCRSSG